MFDIGFLELLVVSIVGLLVLGPERLPGAIRTASLWLGKLRSGFNSVRAEIEREIKADEIRQDLHNQSVMQELKRAEQQLRAGLENTMDPDGDTGQDPPSSDAEAHQTEAAKAEAAKHTHD